MRSYSRKRSYSPPRRRRERERSRSPSRYNLSRRLTPKNNSYRSPVQHRERTRPRRSDRRNRPRSRDFNVRSVRSESTNFPGRFRHIKPRPFPVLPGAVPPKRGSSSQPSLILRSGVQHQPIRKTAPVPAPMTAPVRSAPRPSHVLPGAAPPKRGSSSGIQQQPKRKTAPVPVPVAVPVRSAPRPLPVQPGAAPPKRSSSSQSRFILRSGVQQQPKRKTAPGPVPVAVPVRSAPPQRSTVPVRVPQQRQLQQQRNQGKVPVAVPVRSAPPQRSTVPMRVPQQRQLQQQGNQGTLASPRGLNAAKENPELRSSPDLLRSCGVVIPRYRNMRSRTNFASQGQGQAQTQAQGNGRPKPVSTNAQRGRDGKEKSRPKEKGANTKPGNDENGSFFDDPNAISTQLKNLWEGTEKRRREASEDAKRIKSLESRLAESLKAKNRRLIDRKAEFERLTKKYANATIEIVELKAEGKRLESNVGKQIEEKYRLKRHYEEKCQILNRRIDILKASLNEKSDLIMNSSNSSNDRQNRNRNQNQQRQQQQQQQQGQNRPTGIFNWSTDSAWPNSGGSSASGSGTQRVVRTGMNVQSQPQLQPPTRERNIGPIEHWENYVSGRCNWRERVRVKFVRITSDNWKQHFNMLLNLNFLIEMKMKNRPYAMVHKCKMCKKNAPFGHLISKKHNDKWETFLKSDVHPVYWPPVAPYNPYQKKRGEFHGDSQYVGQYEGQAKRKEKDLMKEKEKEQDIQVVAERGKKVCPITQCEIEFPAVNKQCSHVYSRDGIKSYLKQYSKDGRIDCPYTGCKAKVSEASLQFKNRVWRRGPKPTDSSSGGAAAGRTEDGDGKRYIIEID